MRWVRATVYEGRVARTAYELNPQYRTLLVEIDLPNADGHLRPGQHGQAEIELETRENVITIPSSAMVERNDDGSAACFRVADGRGPDADRGRSLGTRADRGTRGPEGG